jgi:hypothetical protein
MEDIVAALHVETRRVAVRSTDWLDASGNDDTFLLRRGRLLLGRLAAGTDSASKLTLCLTRAENDGNASRK